MSGQAENRTAQRMPVPEALREELVHQVVGRVLDHLDLFEDHLLLALHVFRLESGMKHEIRQHVERRRQVLVEDLDVVAGVFLGSERVEVSAERVDLLGDVFRRTRGRALEEHVLDEVRDAAMLDRFVPRSSREPHAHTHRPHVVHRLGDKTDPVREDLSDDHRQNRPVTR